MKSIKDIGLLLESPHHLVAGLEAQVVMSLEERRELVRQVWDYFLESHGIIDINYNETDKFERFLRREGL